jgi:hypothetical protein
MVDTLTVTNARKLPGDRDGATRYVTPDDKVSQRLLLNPMKIENLVLSE